MKIQHFTHKFIFLFVFLLFGTAYFLADPTTIETQLTHVVNAQTIPMANPSVVDLSELDFRVAVAATTVAPGEIVLFTLQVTNTTTSALAPIALVTTPPSNTTFSLAESSAGWIQSGTQTTPCADGHPAGFGCFFLFDGLQAGEMVETLFAVKIDDDLPIGDEQISLLANLYPADQQPLAPNAPPPVVGQDDPSPNQDAIQEYIFLPIFN